MSPMSLGRSDVYFIVTDEVVDTAVQGRGGAGVPAALEAGNYAPTVGGAGRREHSQSPPTPPPPGTSQLKQKRRCVLAYLVSEWPSRLCPPAAEWQQAGGPGPSTARGLPVRGRRG